MKKNLEERGIEKILIAMSEGQKFVNIISDHLPRKWNGGYEFIFLKDGGELKAELQNIRLGTLKDVMAVVVDSSEVFEKYHIIGQYVGKIEPRIFLCGNKTDFESISNPDGRVIYIDRTRPYDLIGKIHDALVEDRTNRNKASTLNTPKKSD
ncbi:MAG: hypothetical protein AABW51_02255 [Nanoarchaeota archaeon]